MEILFSSQIPGEQNSAEQLPSEKASVLELSKITSNARAQVHYESVLPDQQERASANCDHVKVESYPLRTRYGI